MAKLFIIVLIATAVVAIPNFNQITDCRSSSDCAMSDCCVIGTCNAMLHTNCKFIFYQKCYFVLRNDAFQHSHVPAKAKSE